MRKCGILFDCDGTLVDSLPYALTSFNFALDQVGAPRRTLEEIKIFFGASADRILLRVLRDEPLALAAFEHYMASQTEMARRTQLHAGVRELLDKLAAHQVPLGVVTGRHARDLAAVLRPHNLAENFVTLVADSELAASKPAPEGILLAARRMGLAPENLLYVGDSATDVRAARNAGATAVAALWDTLAAEEDMRAEKPRFLARTADEVWTAFLEFAAD